jgi:hypothetical protein
VVVDPPFHRRCTVDTGQVDLVQDDEVGESDLLELQLDQIGVVIAEDLVRVDDAGDAVESDSVAIRRVDEGHVDARRVGDPARFQDDVLDRLVAVDQRRDRLDEIVADLTAHTPVRQRHHPVLDIDDEFGVDVDRPEVVHEDPDREPVITGEDVIDQRRLPGPEEAGQDRQRDRQSLCSRASIKAWTSSRKVSSS